MLDPRTAPTAARKLSKGTGHVRAKLDSASRSEEQGVQGAMERRVEVTTKFRKHWSDAERIIKATYEQSDALRDAGHVLRSGQTSNGSDRIIRLAALAVRIGLADTKRTALADRCADLSERSEDAADKAADRLGDADMDLRATDAFAAYLSALADKKFNKDHPTVQKRRQDYLAFKRAST